jgi:methylmalonyl-CoA mutase cobalamin-binding subunit
MLHIINFVALHCAGFGVSVLLNDFSAMAMGGRRGFHAALAAKLIKECQSEGAEHIYLVLVT